MRLRQSSLENELLQALSDEVGMGWRCIGRLLDCKEPSLLSSCWQKSIRRGDADTAIDCAVALHRLNPAYVFRRLRGVALEEVSIADLQLVAQVLAVAGKHSLHRKLGERELVASLTARLAAAPKCRTACDLLMWLPPTASKIDGRIRHPEFSASVLAKCNSDALKHSAALWQSVVPRSVRTRQGWRTESCGDALTRNSWLDAANVPPLVRFVVERGNTTDSLNVLLVLAFQLAQGETARVASSTPTPLSTEKIGGLPAYAHCLFSEPGRASLRLFLAAHPHWRSRFRAMGVNDPMRTLGHLVFQIEGGYCSETITFRRASEIKTISEIATLGRFGVPAGEVVNLQRETLAALPELNAARREIWGGSRD